MPYFNAPDGAQIAYDDAGNGRPLLLMHGLMAHREFFRLQAPLAEDFRLITVDLRGHGASRHDDRATTVELMAADVAALIEAMELEAVLGIGWSLGATVLWHLLTGPSASRFAGSIVIDMTPRVLNGEGWDLGLSREMCEARRQAIADDFAGFAWQAGEAIFAQPVSDAARPLADWSAQEFARNDPRTTAAMWESLVDQDLRARLRDIRQPALIVHGAESQLYGAATANYLACAIADARVAQFECSGHAPHMEEPALFNLTVQQFAASLPRVRETQNSH